MGGPGPHVPLQIVPGVGIRIEGPQRTVVHLGDVSIDCGEHGLSILAMFRRPCTLQEAAERLAARAASGTAWAEIFGMVTRLHAAGLLAAPDGRERALGARGFGTAAEHVRMLDDRVRTDAFLRAVRETVRPGDVVVDLGTGTGMLAIAAALAGARHVYAIEATGIANAAAAMIDGNQVGDRVTLIRGWSTNVTVPEAADVLVSETLGHHPWGEGLLHLVEDARRRWLRPDARIVPARVRLLAQPVGVPADRHHVARFTPESTERWTAWYGIDCSSLLSLRDATAMSVRLQEAREWLRPCPPVVIDDVDLHTAGAPLRERGSSTVTPTEDGTVDGVLLYWDAELCPGVRLSTDPASPHPVSSWRVRLVLAPTAARVRRGEPVTLEWSLVGAPSVQVRPAAAAAP